MGKLEILQVPEVDRQYYGKTDGARYLNKVAVCLPAARLSPPVTAVETAGLQSTGRELQTPKTGDGFPSPTCILRPEDIGPVTKATE